jgi:hypothetical protein
MILKPFKYLFSVYLNSNPLLKEGKYTKLSKCCCLHDFKELLNHAFPSENSPFENKAL